MLACKVGCFAGVTWECHNRHFTCTWIDLRPLMEEQLMLEDLSRFKNLHSGWQGPEVTVEGSPVCHTRCGLRYPACGIARLSQSRNCTLTSGLMGC